MAENIKVRLRSFAVHFGKRLRPGAIVDFSTDDLIDGRLPSWAETCDQTDKEILSRYINLNDADRIALYAKRDADKAHAALEEAKRKVDEAAAKLQEADKVAGIAKATNEKKKKDK
jgi:hypothetical protein